MEKLITVTDKEDNLVVSLKINWENKTVESIYNDNYEVKEGEAPHKKDKLNLYRIFYNQKDLGIIDIDLKNNKITQDTVPGVKIIKI